MQTQIQIRLKSPLEAKVNMYGVERCAVSKCNKTKRCSVIGEHRLCFFHANQVKAKGAQLIVNTYSETSYKERRMCHAKNCTETYNLRRGFRGRFCQEHYDSLSSIRDQLNKARYFGNIFAEIHWRRQEVEFRKFPDPTHLIWLEQLELHYGRDFPPHYLNLPDLPFTSILDDTEYTDMTEDDNTEYDSTSF